MDLLISMKAEPVDKGLEPYWKTMFMPTAQSSGYFIAEFREGDTEKIKLLMLYVDILRGKLDSNNFLIEITSFGFLLKKRVDENLDYIEAWEKWVVFSRMLYDELIDVIGD